MIYGPTFEEMLHPSSMSPEVRQRASEVRDEDPLHPANLFNITWRDSGESIHYILLPEALTGVKATIVVLVGSAFPSGSLKVGPAYAVLLEQLLMGKVDPAKHTLVWPSTGNFGIGGAWVGGRMGCDSVVILPEEMSEERFEMIAHYGARIIKTPGSESNVKEIYDETKRLKASGDPYYILNQFEMMGNYRFHYHVTGNTAAELADELYRQGIGSGRVDAFVSAMGSGGSIAAGDRLKQIWPETRIVGLEPVQCPTLYNNGYGSHDIQGIGDKHVTWIHNVWNMDALMCIDDLACQKGLYALADAVGLKTLAKRYRIDPVIAAHIGRLFGISSICNILGAIKTAKYYNLGENALIVTLATDSLDRYHSVMDRMRHHYGELDEARAMAWIESVFHAAATDWIMPGTHEARTRWHNLKYYTWVEQQGKTVEELDAQRDPQWWITQQRLVHEIDGRLEAARTTQA